MKKNIFIMILLVIFVGCTAPTQPHAENSLQIAAKQTDTISYDMAGKAYFYCKELTIEKVMNEDDPIKRKEIVNNMANEFLEISYLEVQYERARSLMRNVMTWVRAQRGIFDVIVDDVKKVKQNVDNKNTLTTEELTSETVDN